MKKVVVISLGGSLIIPDKVDYAFLEKFKKSVKKLYGKYKFVVVCGGGAIARAYIDALKEEHRNKYALSQAGIRATRMNALFMTQFFEKESNGYLPRDMKEVHALLKKNNIVFTGALRYMEDATSDSIAAELANNFKTFFINLTDVDGLYTDNPRKNKNAKLISFISWKDFEKMALTIKYSAGQHFVLDQNAAVMIRKYRIKTYILGKNLKQMENLLREISQVDLR